jgi:hypothetical protein
MDPTYWGEFPALQAEPTSETHKANLARAVDLRADVLRRLKTLVSLAQGT